jgi:hypothetical protein
LANGDGTFVKKNIKVGGGQHSVLIKDINSDGKRDVVGSLFFHDAIFILPGLGNGSLMIWIFLAPELPSTIAIEDFNDDGFVDIVVVCELDNIVSILYGKDTRNFINGSDFVAGNRPAALIVSDLNNDNKSDITVANWYTDDITIFLRK